MAKHHRIVARHYDAGLGSGKRIPANALQSLPHDLPLVIAGGITADNIKEIIRLCQPDIIDVNSGVESAPGKKDIQKIYELQRLIFQN